MTKDINYDIIKEAFDNSTKLHIKLKNGNWRNGYIEKIEPSFFILNDEITGKEAIFFLELKEVSPYMEDEKDGK